jgi:hypothetical protein
MSIKPKVGDYIYFEVEKQANGKFRAINCRIEGVAAKAIQTPRVHRNTSIPKSKVVLIFLVIAIGAFGYQRLGLSTATKPTELKNNALTSDEMLKRAFSHSESNSTFSCDGRQHCSQMTSRAEAEFFIRHCPGTKMDGDNDGIPCENDSRFKVIRF